MLETKLMRHLQCTGNYPLGGGGVHLLFCSKQVCATKRGVFLGVLLTFEQSNTCLCGPGTLEQGVNVEGAQSTCVASTIFLRI